LLSAAASVWDFNALGCIGQLAGASTIREGVGGAGRGAPRGTARPPRAAPGPRSEVEVRKVTVVITEVGDHVDNLARLRSDLAAGWP
jgi:hypothetical protein